MRPSKTRGRSVRCRPKTGWRILPVAVSTAVALVCVAMAGSEVSAAAAAREVPSFADRVLEIVAAGLLVGAGTLGVAGARAHLEITADGQLRVRSIPPWRTRRIELAKLARVSSHPAEPCPGPMNVRLTDGEGRRLRLLVDGWQDERRLVETLSRWADASAAEVREAERGLLDRALLMLGTRS